MFQPAKICVKQTTYSEHGSHTEGVTTEMELLLLRIENGHSENSVQLLKGSFDSEFVVHVKNDFPVHPTRLKMEEFSVTFQISHQLFFNGEYILARNCPRIIYALFLCGIFGCLSKNLALFIIELTKTH